MIAIAVTEPDNATNVHKSEPRWGLTPHQNPDPPMGSPHHTPAANARDHLSEMGDVGETVNGHEGRDRV